MAMGSYMYINVIITVIVNFPSSGLCDITTSQFLGCWPDYSLVRRNSEVIVTGDIALLQSCKDTCFSTGYSKFILIEVIASNTRRCDCAEFAASPVNRYDPQCADGTPLQSGNVEGMYAVYSTEGSSGGSPASTTEPSALTSESPSNAVSSATECDTSCDCTSQQITSLTFDDLTPEQQAEILDMKQRLLVNKKELSSFIRSKTSAKDDRPTAKGIGSIGIVMLVLSAAVILIMDSDKIIIGTHNWIKFFKSMRYSFNNECRNYDNDVSKNNLQTQMTQNESQ